MRTSLVVHADWGYKLAIVARRKCAREKQTLESESLYERLNERLWMAGGMRGDSSTWLQSVQGSWLRSRAVHEVSLEVLAE